MAPGVSDNSQSTVLMWLWELASNSLQYLCGSGSRCPAVHSTYVALGAGVQQFTVLMWLWELASNSSQDLCGSGSVQQFIVPIYIYNVAPKSQNCRFRIIGNGLANDCRFHEMGSGLPNMHKSFQNLPISRNQQLIPQNRQLIT